MSPPDVRVYSTAMRTRFRGLMQRTGVLICGDAGWGEFSPFPEYDDATATPWLRAARETADLGWPAPVRDRIPVNVTVPAVGPEIAQALVSASRCTTAKVKVAERLPGGSLEPVEAELARLGAVADAVGPGGAIRVDANGAWEVDEAVRRLRLYSAALPGMLEYAEQPCATVEQLASLRRRLIRAGIDVPIAADESIRRADDPLRVAALDAADIVVLKVQPLGGVRACLDLADRIRLPCVVSSALESSVGLAAGVALAAALPDLPFACGLGTSLLLAHDPVTTPLVPVDGWLPVVASDDPRLAPRDDSPAMRPSSQDADWWRSRFNRVSARLSGAPAGGDGNVPPQWRHG